MSDERSQQSVPPASASEVKGERDRAADRSAAGDSLATAPASSVERADEPPVVARLVVEIRSDGSRTIARGAMEDVLHGERVSLEARGDSPLSLAMALARSMLSVPALARGRVSKLRRALGRGGSRKGD
ncbi:hypothetical protein [Haliangium ochraceum]|uniref:Uncharacterized protein n=1 Tax=Haliangium ochraceum (strain DSM 14365 / JCM 11303 / SMP-2) TaxID=502025 RepID=D0LV27_HALO1|nr:hypothetical protein [Haliangium ochraceum]ACY15868.1 hypothetical protein Hoch_3366 [Haliangium ochraceum DSM 14365]